jgi:Sigma-70, region 4
MGLSPEMMSESDPGEVECMADESWEPPLNHGASWPVGRLRLRRQGINRFLEAVYHHPRLLSGILREGGLDGSATENIRQCHLRSFLEDVVQGWSTEFSRDLAGPRWYILVRRFSLDGEPPLTLADIGLELGLSRERVRQLQNSAISRLGSRTRKAKLEGIVVRLAQRYRI